MRKLSPIIFLALYFFIYGHSSGQNWQLVWSDEFNNGISSDWVFETGRGASGWGNNELQYYRRENATVQNGHLVITAKRENFNGANYTSARMKTQGRKSWKYGKIEARIAMPAFQGVWPAFWMLGDNISSVGWPSCGEIDIMEHVNTGGEVVGTMHWADPNGHHAEYGGRTNTNVTDFHIYSIEWNATSIKWFLDGRQYHEASIANNVNSTHEFHNNFFILLNMAIGGNWPGFSVDNNALPANMYVDYVRVYQDNGTPPGGVTNLAGTYFLQNRHSGLYMDVAGSGTADGSNVHQWSYNGNSNQQFEFAHLGSGIYRITARHSGRSLDVSGVSTANGANVQQWGYGGGANQQFIVRDAGNGYYKLVARHSNKLVEISDFSTTNGGNVQQWADNGQLSAQWRLVPVVPAFSTTIQAENFSAMAGVQIEATTDAGGGQNVGYIDNGDWMAYNSINIPASGTYRVEYRVASQNGGGRLSLDLNAGTIQLGSVAIPSTGGWQNWTTVSHNVSINAGTYNVGVYAQTGGWNINWFRITRVNNARTMLGDADFEEANEANAGESFAPSITLFPNPVDNELQVLSDYNVEEGTLKIFNSMGVEVMQATAPFDRLDVSGLEAGIYHALLTTGHYNATRRFIKK